MTTALWIVQAGLNAALLIMLLRGMRIDRGREQRERELRALAAELRRLLSRLAA